MSDDVFISFNNDPESITVYTGPVTIPSDKYAYVTAWARSGGIFKIDGDNVLFSEEIIVSGKQDYDTIASGDNVAFSTPSGKTWEFDLYYNMLKAGGSDPAVIMRRDSDSDFDFTLATTSTSEIGEIRTIKMTQSDQIIVDTGGSTNRVRVRISGNILDGNAGAVMGNYWVPAGTDLDIDATAGDVIYTVSIFGKYA